MPQIPPEDEDRAERLVRQKEEAAKEKARRTLTAKLRAERLAREAATGKPKNAKPTKRDRLKAR
jgi:hypothetical protein